MYFLVNQAFTQNNYIISGKVTDAQTNEPIAFANVALKGKNIGITTDFDGNYTLNTKTLTDSIWVTYLGYAFKTKALVKNISSQTIDFQLDPTSTHLREVTVRRGENPAYPILRNVIANKGKHDRSNLSAYEYESYAETEIDVDNMSESFRSRKPIQKVLGYMDKLQKIAGEDGQPLLPVFVSEMVTRQYFKSSPDLNKSQIIKAHTTGVGIKNESIITQLMGGTFVPFNFYKNWLRILGKDFISPIADGGKVSYDYFLADSMQIGQYDCYVIDFDPKFPKDLAFRGKMWIDKKSYALVEIDATVTKEANLNFIDKIKIQQELEPTEAVAWIPTKMRTLIDMSQFDANTAGLMAKYYESVKDIVVNKPRPTKFYDSRVDLEDDFSTTEEDTAYWNKRRHESLSKDEMKVYALVDSLKNFPIVRTYIDVIDFAINGHVKLGAVELGAFPLAYAYNNIEVNRFRLGFRTNKYFSKSLYLKGYTAYGTEDKKWKYSLEADLVIGRKPWTMIGLRTTYDLERLGVNADEGGLNNLFLAFNRFGNYNRGYYQRENYGFFRTTIFKGFQQTVGFRTRNFDPVFHFGYYTSPDLSPNSPIQRYYQGSEFIFESRYAPDEVVIQNDFKSLEGRNRRRGIPKWPVFMLRYTRGLQIAGGDFNYHRFLFAVQHSFRLGHLGRTYYTISGGTSPSRVPYPLLFPHLGNNSFFFSDNSYNMMKIGEFVSTSFVGLRLRHDMDGLLFNRIPLIKKLNWRSDIMFNMIVGKNDLNYKRVHPVYDRTGRFFSQPDELSPNEPYMEVGYGISNIFRFMRIRFIHRITYLNMPNHAFDVQKFGIKIAGQFTL